MTFACISSIGPEPRPRETAQALVPRSPDTLYAPEYRTLRLLIHSVPFCVVFITLVHSASAPLDGDIRKKSEVRLEAFGREIDHLFYLVLGKTAPGTLICICCIGVSVRDNYRPGGKGGFDQTSTCWARSAQTRAARP